MQKTTYLPTSTQKSCFSKNKNKKVAVTFAQARQTERKVESGKSDKLSFWQRVLRIKMRMFMARILVMFFYMEAQPRNGTNFASVNSQVR